MLRHNHTLSPNFKEEKKLNLISAHANKGTIKYLKYSTGSEWYTELSKISCLNFNKIKIILKANHNSCFVCYNFVSSHPSDMKPRFHRHHSSGSLHGSFNHNHVQDTNTPLVLEESEEQHDTKGAVYDPKQDVFVSLFVRLLLSL